MNRENSVKSSFFEKYVKTNRLLYEKMHFDSKDEKLLYINMHYFADRDGYLYPSIALLAEMGMCGKTSLYRALEGLEKKGYVQVFRKANRYNIYRIVKQTEPIFPKTSRARRTKNSRSEDLREIKAQKNLFSSGMKPFPFPESMVLPGEKNGPFQGHEHYLINLNSINIPTESNFQISDNLKHEEKTLPIHNYEGELESNFETVSNSNFKFESEVELTSSISKNECSKSESKSEEIDPYDYRKNRSELDQKERGELFDEISELISKGTGVDKLYVVNTLVTRSLNLEHMRLLRDKIKESDFLMGKLKKKPKINHFSSNTQIFKIIAGIYKNREEIKSDMPCYHPYSREDEEEGNNYDPIY